MIAGKKNLILRRGVTFGETGTAIVFRFRTVQTPVTVPPVYLPVDLTGYGVFAQYSKTPGDPHRFDLGASWVGGPGVGDVTGDAQLYIEDVDTLAHAVGDYGWDLMLRSPAGEVSGPWIKGTLQVINVHTLVAP